MKTEVTIYILNKLGISSKYLPHSYPSSALLLGSVIVCSAFSPKPKLSCAVRHAHAGNGNLSDFQYSPHGVSSRSAEFLRWIFQRFSLKNPLGSYVKASTGVYSVLMKSKIIIQLIVNRLLSEIILSDLFNPFDTTPYFALRLAFPPSNSR